MPTQSKDLRVRLVGLEGPRGIRQRKDADRQVDEEDPVPRVVLDEVATEDRAADGGRAARHTEDRHEAPHALRAWPPGHDRHAERHEHAATEAPCRARKAMRSSIDVAIAHSVEPSERTSASSM